MKPRGVRQQQFMVKKVNQLLKHGLIVKCAYPRFVCPAFPVEKPHQECKAENEKDYRMIIDMKKLNDVTIKTPLVLPNLEEQLLHLKGAIVFAALDILSGFDYLMTAAATRAWFCFITTFGTYSFVGAPQGWMNTPSFFSNRIFQEILFPNGLLGDEFNDFKRRVLQWIDDTLIFGATFDIFIESF